MDNARKQTQARLDAACFWQIWQRFDKEEKGYIKETELDAFFDHLLAKSGTEDTLMEENVQKVKEQLMTGHDVSKEGRILMKEAVSAEAEACCLGWGDSPSSS